MLQIVIFVKEVTVIFKDLVTEVYEKTLKFVKDNKIFVRFTAFALVAVLSLVICIVSCGITVGYKVEYAGKDIAVVSSKEVFDTARDTVLQKLSNGSGENSLAAPKYTLTLTLESELTQADTLADTIIENTEDLTFSSALKVNGEVVAYADRQELDDVVKAALCKYYVEGAENNSTFVDDVEICEGYCFDTQIKTTADLEAVVNSLKVKTVSTVTTESAVKYSTKIVYTSKEYRGYEEVQTKGEKGVESEVAVVETVNGEQTAKTVVSRKVVKEPVEKVVLKGTATKVVSATSKAEAQSQGFIRPMNKGDIKMISAYWGDGRNHKAIDFAGDQGVPIFASKGGKVTFSGWDGNYGYAVVIDHGNGYQTRYAHASALCVKKGETVTQGQQVAKLGNTGRSTGPHLHFEILKNGRQVNPAPYIGY